MHAIAFDLDGTLLDFDRPYRELLAQTFESVTDEVREPWIETYETAFFELFDDCEPDPVRRAFDRVDFDALEWTPDPTVLAETLLERECATARTPDGVETDLERLEADGYGLGVVTNGVREWQLAKLRAVGLETHFDTVVASYDVGTHKPDPAPFRRFEARLRADRYAMVGDSETDSTGADGAGWATHRYEGGGFDELPFAIDW